jgi:hypothetical protein
LVRTYRLGKRQARADRTHERIVSAARELVAEGTAPSVGAIAGRAGVSRITVYNRFGSKAGLMSSLVPSGPPAPPPDAPPREQLRRLLSDTCLRWAADPAMYRHLPPPVPGGDVERRLAERLAESDDLRPGCSIKEAEDVIAALTSFAVFDRLHRDGRRPAGAVAEILLRLAGGILGYHP